MFDEDEEDVLTSAEIRCVVASAGAQCLAELKVNEYLRSVGQAHSVPFSDSS